MKKSYFAVILLTMLTMAACSSGGSSGGSTAVQIANNAIAALDNITDNWTCTTNVNTTCVCPGGGTAVFSGDYDPSSSVSKATQTVNVTNCTDSSSGLTFSGTMSVDEDTGEGTIDFATFGQCTNFDGTFDLSGGTCGGTATGTCSGEALTCNWTESGDDCICAS